jgi:hypothetical protein
LQHLSEPSLQHIESEDASGKEEEDAELEQEFAKVAPRQCVVERLIPAVEANLSVGCHHDDGDDLDRQNHDLLAHGRARDRLDHQGQLPQEA